MKIRTKLLIGAIAIILLIGTTVITGSHFFFEQETKRQIDREGMTLALAFSKESALNLANRDARMTSFLREVYESRPDIKYITLLSEGNTIISHIGNLPKPPSTIRFTPTGASIAESETPEDTTYEFTQRLANGKGSI